MVGDSEEESNSCLSLRDIFPLHFLDIVVLVTASGPPHVLRLWLGVGKGMLPVKYFCSNKASFLCQSNLMDVITLSQS